MILCAGDTILFCHGLNPGGDSQVVEIQLHSSPSHAALPLVAVFRVEKYCSYLLHSLWWNRELTLKCKLKCYEKPMKDPWALALVKGIREPHEVKKKFF